jgi:NADH-quinone oxidoreductase subunit C
MIEQLGVLKNELLDIGVDVAETDYSQRGYHMEVAMTVDQVRNVAQKMYENDFYLVFVAGYQVQPEQRQDIRTSGLHLTYQFARYDRPCRINAGVALAEDKTVSSICDIYQGANWHERETRDFFGVIFAGHPNLKPLLLREEDTDFHPLLKEQEQIKTLTAVSWQPATPDIGDGEVQKDSSERQVKKSSKKTASDRSEQDQNSESTDPEKP